MVNPPRVRLGGARVGEGLGARSLILTNVGFFLVTFLAFLGVDGVAAILRLPSRVLDDLAQGTYDDVPADVALGVRAERGTAATDVSPSKLGIRATKFSKACKASTRRINNQRKIENQCGVALPYLYSAVGHLLVFWNISPISFINLLVPMLSSNSQVRS
jgi:hypothetical protein